MVFEHIEKLKEQYTDQYVQVDSERPELARFQNVVGQVRTVNMSGRALVEFSQYHLNIGWYDIDLDYLKVVDKPPEPEAPKKAAKPAKKPAPTAKAAAGDAKKMSPLEMARAQGAAKNATDGDGDKKPSVAEILAAARKPKSDTAEAPAAEKPAAKADRSKMSVAEMLAAARGEKSGESPEAPAAEPATAVAEAAAPEEPAPAEESAPADGAADKVDRSQMSVDQITAWCRQHDAD